jgi:D-alanyl-D-alanine carboxypeptidase/D-alanyl-D-alanine-endopeptidase (penicillin-binding protein 4)
VRRILVVVPALLLLVPSVAVAADLTGMAPGLVRERIPSGWVGADWIGAVEPTPPGGDDPARPVEPAESGADEPAESGADRSAEPAVPDADEPEPEPRPQPQPVTAEPVLPPLDDDALLPTSAGLGAALGPPLADPALGDSTGAVVLDAATGETLFDRGGDVGRTPASVAKLITAASALAALGPQTRLETTVVAGAAPGELVLVGGGDPTLATTPTDGDVPPGRTSLRELAAATVETLRSDSTPPPAVSVRVDDGLFEGPLVSPDWEERYVPNGEVAPVSALSVDSGRLDPLRDGRTEDPALAAGEAFAEVLAEAGLDVEEEVTRGAAPQDAPTLASLTSPPVSALVEEMLLTSDNDIAEALYRLAAIARDEPATFQGAAAAATGVLTELGIPTQDLDLRDGSGLAQSSQVAPQTVAALLAVAADEEHPQLRSMLTGLPVAGFSGTLAARFDADADPDADPDPDADADADDADADADAHASDELALGAGAVRAKTGTLRDVSSLAGVVADADGRALIFALLADDLAGGPLAASEALDQAAGALAGCGCRSAIPAR